MRCTMTQTLTRALVALTFATMAVRPAYAANKEQQQLAADLRILQQQAQQLQNLIGSMNTALTEALKAVNARIDEQTSGNRKTFADQKLVIDNLSSDLRIVREKVDDNNLRIASLSQEVDALRQAVQQVPRSSSTFDSTDPGGAASAGGTAGGPTGAPPPAQPPPAAGVGSPTRVY